MANLRDCKLVSYTDDDQGTAQQFLEYARDNEDSANPIFQEIERDDAGKEPKTKEDPDRSQLSVNGNDKVKPFQGSVAIQKLLHLELEKVFQDKTLTANSL